MTEGIRLAPLVLDPGPERRAMLRGMGVRISRDDFSRAEWAAIEVEAPGIVKGLWDVLDGDVTAPGSRRGVSGSGAPRSAAPEPGH